MAADFCYDFAQRNPRKPLYSLVLFPASHGFLGVNPVILRAVKPSMRNSCCTKRVPKKGRRANAAWLWTDRMLQALQIGLSGLVASSSRLQVSANNIVNANTTSRVPEATQTLASQNAYQPLRAQNTPVATGGVRSTPVPVSPSQLTIFSPSDLNANEDGLVNIPNVSLAEEFVQMTIALQTYKANAAVIRVAAEMEDSLLDAFKK